MAIDTDNKKLALMSLEEPWMASVPISSDGLGQDDKQHLIWGYPGILWGAGPGATIMAQLRGVHRRIASRVFGRVN